MKRAAARPPGQYRKTLLVAALALAAGLGACKSAPPAASPPVVGAAPDLQRGRLLYENSCNTCHTTQPHWREQRRVKTLSDLVAQVERWQDIAHAGWKAQDIQDVVAYLNAAFYHLPCDACGGPSARN
ncbi:MAG TPA: cytochrome C [Burkholderiales bacterium]|nr:cytochrome C [Burkholderiales bacterium]